MTLSSRASDATRTNVVAFVALAIIGLLVFSAGLRVPYYADDYGYVFRNPSEHIFRYFWERNPNHPFYRPTITVIATLDQTWFGMSTLFTHLVNLTTHVFIAWLVFRTLRAIGGTMAQACVGATYMLVSQGIAFAVQAPDNLSQVFGTAGGVLALWLLHRSYREDGTTDWGARVGSFAAFVFALISKETGVSFAPLAGLVVLIHALRNPGMTRGFGALFLRLVREYWPYVVLVVAYVAWRGHVLQGVGQPHIGAERYDFAFGLNIPKNLAMLFGAGLLQLSTVTVMQALAEGNHAVVLVGVGSAAVVAALTAFGLLRGRRLATGGVVFVMAVGSVIPAIFVNHVSELYVYNLMPFLSVLVGLGLGALITPTEPAWQRAVAGTLLGAMLVGNVFATRTKGRQLDANGRLAEKLLPQIVERLNATPQSGLVLLVNTVPPGFDYSEFLMRGFGVFKYGETIFPELTGRKDLDVQVVEPSELDPAMRARAVLVLELEDGRVVQR